MADRITLTPSGAKALVLANRGSLGCNPADLKYLRQVFGATKTIGLSEVAKCFPDNGGTSPNSLVNFIAFAAMKSGIYHLTDQTVVRFYAIQHAGLVAARLLTIEGSDCDNHFKQLKKDGFVPPKPDDKADIAAFLYACLGTVVKLSVRDEVVDDGLYYIVKASAINLSDPRDHHHTQMEGIVVPKIIVPNWEKGQRYQPLATHFGMAFASLTTDIGRSIAKKQQDDETVQKLIRERSVPRLIDFRSFCGGDVTNWTVKRLQEIM